MPVISVTRLHVRSWRQVPRVLLATLGAAWQARGSHGNLAVSVFSETYDCYWTRTVWRDEASMMAYVQTGLHRRIMSRLTAWCDQSSVVHWQAPVAVLPPWPQAHRRLSEDGRHFPPCAQGAVPWLTMPHGRWWRELQIK
ncbi:DUF3291 domain-containing protein [Trinickia sp. LjRoot230]|uniref:DUF3291 domain-containing protein n=1 Tax=Trinickia sp. LjRoot230 TaxID=3342288 RepID=UPI003ED037A7